MIHWVAISFGALDLSEGRDFGPDAEIIVLPVFPSEPIGLAAEGALLFRRLIYEEIFDSALSAEERTMVREFEFVGIASRDASHRSRLSLLTLPRLASPLHELCCALAFSVAVDKGIDAVMIKGPALSHQGLRSNRHSVDVDLWVDPSRIDHFLETLSTWGWTKSPDVWDGTAVNHSVTLAPGTWGCEVDVHRHMPGCGVRDDEAFSVVLANPDWFLLASRWIAIPEVSVHAVLYSLHVLRPSWTASSTSIRAVAVNALRLGGERTIRVARLLDATGVLAAVLKSAQFGEEIGPAGMIPLNWQWRSQPNRLRGYMMALRLVPKRQRIRLFLRLVWPQREVVVSTNRNAGQYTARSRWARWRRAFAGVRRESVNEDIVSH